VRGFGHDNLATSGPIPRVEMLEGPLCSNCSAVRLVRPWHALSGSRHWLCLSWNLESGGPVVLYYCASC